MVGGRGVTRSQNCTSVIIIGGSYEVTKVPIKSKLEGATRSQSCTNKIKTVGATSRTSFSFSMLWFFIYFVRFLNKRSFSKIVSSIKSLDQVKRND